MARAACEHPSCQTPADLSSTDLRLELRVGAGGRSYFAVTHGERQLGTVQDSGFRAWDGRWVTCWAAFAGGSAVLLPGTCAPRTGRLLGWHPVREAMVPLDESLVATLHAFAQWCSTTAAGWRDALH